MSDDDRGIFGVFIQIPGSEKIPRNLHVILVLKRNLLHSHFLAFVKIISSLGLLSRSWGADDEHHAQNDSYHS
jgi:hypothetical protein